jgi:putative ABC transport system permease protein
MVNQGEEPLELFALPLWLILAALALGLTVSLIAGYYPSARAARIDPVEALRYE